MQPLQDCHSEEVERRRQDDRDHQAKHPVTIIVLFDLHFVGDHLAHQLVWRLLKAGLPDG